MRQCLGDVTALCRWTLALILFSGSASAQTVRAKTYLGFPETVEMSAEPTSTTAFSAPSVTVVDERRLPSSPSLALEPSPAVTTSGLIRPLGRDLTVTVGGQLSNDNVYEGSSARRFSALPRFAVRPAEDPAPFGMPADAIGFSLAGNAIYDLGLAFALTPQRNVSLSSDLRGLGDVPYGAAIGFFANYWPRSDVRVHVEMEQSFFGAHGLNGAMSATYVVRNFAVEHLTLALGPRVTMSDDRYAMRFFGVTPAQSMSSGLSTFNTHGGFRATWMDVLLSYELSKSWTVYGFGGVGREIGDGSQSPIVADRGNRTQAVIGMGVLYSFDMHVPF